MLVDAWDMPRTHTSKMHYQLPTGEGDPLSRKGSASWQYAGMDLDLARSRQADTPSGGSTSSMSLEYWATYHNPNIRSTTGTHGSTGMHHTPLQRTHLQQPLLRMSPTAGDETLRGRNPENGRCWDFGRRRQHRQSGFQHTDRPRPSSPELFNKDHNIYSFTKVIVNLTQEVT